MRNGYKDTNFNRAAGAYEKGDKEVNKRQRVKQMKKQATLIEDGLNAIRKNFRRMFEVFKKRQPNTITYNINHLCVQAYETAKSKGWHDNEPETGTLLALIHSEVSEALEADRKGDAENFAEELADVCIRIFDLCGSRGIDLDDAINQKMERNKLRSYKHGGKAY